MSTNLRFFNSEELNMVSKTIVDAEEIIYAGLKPICSLRELRREKNSTSERETRK